MSIGLALATEDQRALAASVLTWKELEAWELVEIQGLSLRAAAAQLGISTSSLRERIDNGRRKVKARIRSEFPASPAALALVSEIGVNLDPAVALLIQRDGPLCYLCRREPARGEHAVEHIIPRSLGGDNAATNLALACAPCNAEKGGKIVSLLVTSGRPVYHPVGAAPRTYLIPARPPPLTR